MPTERFLRTQRSSPPIAAVAPRRRSPGARALVLSLAAVSLWSCKLPRTSPDALFDDISTESGLDFVHDNGMSGQRYFSEVVGPGAALFDYDRDGDLDIYIVQGHALQPLPADEELSSRPKDRLFRNDLVDTGDGHPRPRFVDVTDRSLIEATGYGMGVATGDVNNDGWTDLYVTNFGANELWLNRGDGTFEDATDAVTRVPAWSSSAAFFDYDLDGRLDLYVTNYVEFRIAQHRPCMNAAGAPEYCGPTAYPPESDRLLHNLGDGRFEDVSGASRILEVKGSGLGVVAGDFDDDGFPDLYVANDMMPNRLWLNQGDGTFRDDALLAGCAVNESGAPEASMGIAVGDFDRDGDEDLFVAHLDTETNTAYLNQGGGMFVDATNEWRLGDSSVGLTGFGTAPLDYDNDGWLDLVIANGAVKTIAEQRLAGDPLPLKEPNLLLRNEGEARFTSVTDQAPALSVPGVSRGLAVGDIDNDGDVDILILNNNGRAQLLENRVGQASTWVGIDFRANAGEEALLGTRVWIGPQEARQLRTVRTASSYCSASDERLLVGSTGAAATDIEIATPRGKRLRWLAVPAQRYLAFAIGDPL